MIFVFDGTEVFVQLAVRLGSSVHAHPVDEDPTSA